MYQTIVLGLGFLLLIGGGYLIKHIDKENVIGASIATSINATTASSSATLLPGTYLCDMATGCESPRVLTLSESGEAKMNSSYENGVEIVDEFGTWTVNKGGGASVLLTSTANEVYPEPRVLTIKYVTNTTLAGITFDAAVYEDLKNPVFRKQQEEAQ
jgi:hypothetical protein